MKQLLILLSAAVVLTGCGSKKSEQPLDWPSVCAEVDAIREDRGRPAAVEYLKDALADDDLAAFRRDVFTILVGEQLAAGDVAGAQGTYVTFVAENDDCAGLGIDSIAGHLEETEPGSSVAWCDTVLKTTESENVKMQAMRRLVMAHVAADTLSEMLPRLTEVFSLSDARAVSTAMRWIVGAAIQARDFELLNSLLAASRDQAQENPDLNAVLIMAEADSLLIREELQKAETFLFANAQSIDDGSLSSRLLWIMDRLEEREPKSSDRLAYRVIQTLADCPRARGDAAGRWLKRAATEASTDLFVQRSNELLDKNIEVGRVGAEYQKHFYKGIRQGSDAQKAAYLAVGERLATNAALPESRRASLQLLRLDGAFYRKDFAAALAIIDAGIASHDDAWHAEMKNKVSAHLALAEGRPEEAIAMFRKHMAIVEAWEAPVINPENGMSMSKEVVLGFNEKRIGDIYAGIPGKESEAAAAYARARVCYKEALALLEPDSAEHKAAAEELAAVPAAQ